MGKEFKTEGLQQDSMKDNKVVTFFYQETLKHFKRLKKKLLKFENETDNFFLPEVYFFLTFANLMFFNPFKVLWSY